MVNRALRLTGVGRFDIIELPIDPPRDDEVVVEVEAVTTCPQWDMHLWRGEPMFERMSLEFPYVPGQPGHEMVGRVLQAGRSVTTLSVGQRVAVWRDVGHGVHGCYATHVTRQAEVLLPMPDDLPAKACAPLELAMCVSSVFMDLEAHGFFPCQRLGVAGLGPSGLIAMQMARALGVEEVVGFDLDDNRRAFAERLGYGRTANNGKCGFPGRREEGSLDIGIECVGHPAAFEFLADHTRGVVAIFGVQRTDYPFKPDYNSQHGLRVWGYTGHHRAAGEFAREMVLSGKVNLVPLATHQVPLRNYDRAVDLLLKREAVKVCLLCDRANL